MIRAKPCFLYPSLSLRVCSKLINALLLSVEAMPERQAFQVQAISQAAHLEETDHKDAALDALSRHVVSYWSVEVLE